MVRLGSWLRGSHLLKSTAKHPSATERPGNTKGMVLEARERGCLVEVIRHPVTGKADSRFGVTAHKADLQITLSRSRLVREMPTTAKAANQCIYVGCIVLLRRETMLNEYVFSVLPWGKEISVAAASEKSARRIAWDSLPDMAKNNTEGLECVDEGTTQHQVEGVTATQF